MERTTPFRNDSNSESLFVGSNKPHIPVSSSTIARWIKEQLKEAGVGHTSVFSAHSARGAATSKAMNRDVPIQSILNLATGAGSLPLLGSTKDPYQKIPIWWAHPSYAVHRAPTNPKFNLAFRLIVAVDQWVSCF